MAQKLARRAAVVELIAALVKAPRTMRELCEWTDFTDETVNAWLTELRESRLVYIADYLKNPVGCDSPVYAWVTSGQVDVLPPQLSTVPSSVYVRENYRRRRDQRARRAPAQPIAPEVRAWQPRLVDDQSPHLFCALCSKRVPQLGCRWFFTGLERVRVCGPCAEVKGLAA